MCSIPDMASPLVTPDWCDRSVTQVAPDLIGCTLVRQLGSTIVRSLIVETEAYGPEDPACHAYRGKTASNAPMFGPPGQSYVYFIYGMYHCFNVVTDACGTGSAVLIRAVAPETLPPDLAPQYRQQGMRVAAGPGKLCRTLAIERRHSGLPLLPASRLWIEQRTAAWHSALAQGQAITQTTRIGISKAKEYPWRWYLTGHPSISKP